MAKQLPCCARRTSSVSLARADLRALARKASAQPHRKAFFLPKIAAAKASIQESLNAQIEHEAQHAGEDAA
jgi:hypothetical protein